MWLTVAPIIGRLTLAVLAAMLGMYFFADLAHEVARGETRQFDFAVLAAIREHRPEWLFHFMRWYSWLGGPVVQPVVFALLVLGFVAARRFWPDGLTLLLAGLGGTALIYFLKRAFHRPRPEVIFDELGYSFPSGHTFFALVLYCMAAYWLARDAPPRRRFWIWTVAVLATGLMGLSRMVLGEHFPSDVAASLAIGIPWVWGCLALPKAFHRGGRDISPEEKRARYQSEAAQLMKAAAALPQIRQLMGELSGDTRLPQQQRRAAAFLHWYIGAPVDLIPDFIPLLGKVDDLLLTRLALRWIACSNSVEAVYDHWCGVGDPLEVLDNAHATLATLWRRA